MKSLFDRLRELDQWLLDALSPQAGWNRRRGTLSVAGLLFVAVAVVSFRGVDEVEFQPLWLLLVLLGSVLSTLINAMEYRLASRAASAEAVSLRHSLQIAVLGSAANLMPLPGAVMIRSQAMRASGVGGRASVASNVAVGLVWVGVASLVVAVALSPLSSLASLVFAVIATCGIFLGARLAPHPRWFVPRIVSLEFAFVVVGAVRAYGAFQALGQEVGVVEVVLIPVASAMGSALGLLPGGLGIREALAGLLGVMVGQDAAQVALAASLDRLVGLGSLAALAGLALVWRRVVVRPAGSSVDA